MSPLSSAAETRRRASPISSSTGGSSGSEEEIDEAPILGEVHDSAAQYVRGVVAARIEAHRRTYLLRRPGLVDVAMEPDDGLMALDHIPNRLATDWDDAGAAASDHW